MLLNWNIKERGFDYHPKCEEMELTHVIFADDLFLITAATKHSFQVLNGTIVEFGEISGLKPNLMKCNVFLAGVDEECAMELCQIVNMPG